MNPPMQDYNAKGSSSNIVKVIHMFRQLVTKQWMPWLTHLLFSLMAFIWIIPLLWVLITAFRPENESIGQTLFPQRLTFETLQAAWSYAPFLTYYLNTVIISLGILLAQLITSILAAYAFARLRFPGQNILFFLFLLHMMIPMSALVIPNYMTMQKLGLINTLWAIMLPYFGSGFGTFLLRQSFRSIPQAYEDAAKIDGAGFFRIIRHVYVPLSMPAIISFVFFSISFHWNDFFWPLIVTDDDRVRPLTVGLAKFTQAAEAGANWQLIAAGTFIVVTPLLLAFMILLKKARNSITPTLNSGVK